MVHGCCGYRGQTQRLRLDRQGVVPLGNPRRIDPDRRTPNVKTGLYAKAIYPVDSQEATTNVEIFGYKTYEFVWVDHQHPARATTAMGSARRENSLSLGQSGVLSSATLPQKKCLGGCARCCSFCTRCHPCTVRSTLHRELQEAIDSTRMLRRAERSCILSGLELKMERRCNDQRCGPARSTRCRRVV
jgi:hypothetical protein